MGMVRSWFFVVFVVTAAIAVGWWATSADARTGTQKPSALVVLPGIVEAENFDLGGQDVAFNDVDESFGNVRMREAVDVYKKDNVGASRSLVGRTRNGEWLEYTVQVAEADDFVARIAVASGSADPGSVQLSIDGDVVGEVSGDTDRWFDWTTRVAGEVSLDPGEHVLRLDFIGNSVNVDWFDLRPVVPGPPECETGVIEAEHASASGRFVKTLDWAASGRAYMHVEHGTGGWFTGISDSYLEFCVGVDEPGAYRIDSLVRMPTARDNSFFVSVDEGPLAHFVGEVTGDEFAIDAVNEAAALDQLREKDTPGAIVDPLTWDLDVGDHRVRFYLRRDGAQLDTIELVRVGDQDPTPTPTPVTPTPTPVTPTPTPEPDPTPEVRLEPVANLLLSDSDTESVTLSWEVDDDSRRQSFDAYLTDSTSDDPIFADNPDGFFNVSDPNATTLTIEGLPAGGSFNFEIRAIGDRTLEWVDELFYSETVSLPVSTDFGQPLPERLVAPADLTLDEATTDTITVSWSNDDDPRRVSLDSYLLAPGESETTENYQGLPDPQADVVTFTDLEPATTYRFRIRAIGNRAVVWPDNPDSPGDELYYSETVELTVTTEGSGEVEERLAPVADLLLLDATATSVTVGWSLAGDDPRRVSFDTYIVGPAGEVFQDVPDGNATSVTFDQLQPDTEYEIRVLAIGNRNLIWPTREGNPDDILYYSPRATIQVATVPGEALPVISVSSPTISEGDGVAVVDVTISAAADIEFTVFTQGAAATAEPGVDFFGFSETTSFTAGGPLTQSFEVQILDDGLPEDTETIPVRVTVEDGTPAMVGSPGTVTILDDD